MSQPRRMKKWWFSDPIYDVSVLLIHGTFKALMRVLANTFGDCGSFGTESSGKSIWVDHKRGVALVIWLPDRWHAKNSHHLGTLAHETQHGAHHVLRSRKIRFTQASEEAFTYYQAWLYRQCHERLTR